MSQTARVQSIDLLRGITIIAMIFVNEIGWLKGMPHWLLHAKYGEDFMGFSDWVFPSFLFIVGMSIPLALSIRKQKGDSTSSIIFHILKRTIGLLTIGVFMVNAESLPTDQGWLLGQNMWRVLVFIAAILVWINYPKSWPDSLKMALQAFGILLFVALYFSYHPLSDLTMGFHWWGILGLIGWVYLIGSTIYMLVGNRAWVYVLVSAFFIFLWIGIQTTSALSSINFLGPHLTHTYMALNGIALSLIITQQQKLDNTKKIILATVYACILLIIAFLLRPAFGISKIGATPSWALISTASTILLFLCIYWWTDINNNSLIPSVIIPPAKNPLLIYIIPYIFHYTLACFGLELYKYSNYEGITAIFSVLIFCGTCIYLTKKVNENNLYIKL